MTHESVSTPYPRHQVVRTSGRAPAVQPNLPTLSPDAALLVAGLPRDLDSVASAVMKLIQEIAEQPTRAGVEVLRYFAEIYRNAAQEKYPAAAESELAAADSFAKLSEAVGRAVAMKESLADLAAAMKESLEDALAVGVAAGRHDLEHELAADATRPVLERRVEFVMDSKDRVVGKIEREYKNTGGKKVR